MENEQELSALQIARLITRQLNGSITSTEQITLERWKEKSDANRRLYNQLTNEAEREEALGQIGKFNTDAALQRFQKRIALRERKRPVIQPLFIKLAAAASVLLILSIGFYFYHQHSQKATSASMVKNDALPGRNKAILILADGRKVNLDAANGTVSSQAGILINKTNKGQLVYKVLTLNTNAPIEYNTIITPNGGQYQVVLPDSTKVWLNAASSLRYPTRFEGKQRLVTLTGEGYFEVTHDRIKPFIVQTTNQQVQVLGTHFNISSYSNEPVVTTLLKGSVKVTSNENRITKHYLLKPGEMVVHQAGRIDIQPADLEESVAWKNGQFIFHDTDLKTIMREVQRWYDVDVSLGRLPDEKFNGIMNRNVRLSQLLHMLETTSSLKFKIEGRRIMLQN